MLYKNMSAKSEYSRQFEIAKWIDDRFKVEFPSDRRTNVVLCCFDLTIEHHAAILVLENSGLYGSMSALFRVIFESFIRGMYLQHCATEKELDLFQQDKFDKKHIGKDFGGLIEAIEEAIDLVDGPFSRLKRDSYKTMNSFTHTGFQHLTRRQLNAETGAINYPENERCQLMICAGALVLNAAAQLAALTQKPGLADEVMMKIKAIAEND